MKKAKLARNSKKQEEKEIETYSIKQLLTIILIVLLVFVVFYIITTFVVKPLSSSNNDTTTVIDSDKITFNNLLNRKESEYYVLATKASLYNSYGSKVNYIEMYERYISDYSGDLKFYRIDLDDALNKNYIGDENITDDLSKLKVNDEVLFKISDGKIENYYVGSQSIVKALSSLD